MFEESEGEQQQQQQQRRKDQCQSAVGWPESQKLRCPHNISYRPRNDFDCGAAVVLWCCEGPSPKLQLQLQLQWLQRCIITVSQETARYLIMSMKTTRH
ncbi:hypothetical protein ACLKA6_011653 [Drosophila palustris]